MFSRRKRPGLIDSMPHIIGVFLVLWLGMSESIAQEQYDAESSELRRVIMLTSEHDRERSEEVIRAVQAQLSDLAVSFVVRWLPGFAPDPSDQRDEALSRQDESGAVAIFWCHFTGDQRVFLVLDGSGSEPVLTRPLTGTGEDGFAESLAIILRTTIQVALEGAATELVESSTWTPLTTDDEETDSTVPRQSAPVLQQPFATQGEAIEQPSEQPTAVRVEPHRISLAIEYRLELWSQTHPIVHAFPVTFDARLVHGFHLFIGYVFSLPLEASDEFVELTLTPHPAFFGVRYHQAWRRVGLSGALAFAFNSITEKVETSAPLVSTSSRGTLLFSMDIDVELTVDLARRLQLLAAFGLSIPLNNTRFIAQWDDENQILVESRGVHPYFLVGLSVGIF